jgi:hypothetical protein
MVSNLPINSANIFSSICKFMLAKSPNPLKQGVSSNHKPQKKPRLTREFNPQAEGKAMQASDQHARNVPFGR